MNINLSQKIISILKDIKADRIVCLDARHTSYTDQVIICTAMSNRHLHAIVERVARSAKSSKNLMGIEGKRNQSDWVLIDLGSIIVHIMLEPARQLYQLDKVIKLI